MSKLGFLGATLWAAGALAQVPSEHADVLAAVKEYALEYSKRLPDYICTQTTKRRTAPGSTDLIEEEVTFSNRIESYQVTTINRKKVTNVRHSQIKGTVSFGEFGSFLYNTFVPVARAEFKFDSMATLNGRKMFVFSYQVPAGMGYRLSHQDSVDVIFVAYKGLVYADAETRHVLRLTAKCIDLPRDFPMKEVQVTLDYKPVTIGGQEYTLPFHSKIYIRDTRSNTNTEIDYTRYRKFSADSTLVSEPEPSKP